MICRSELTPPRHLVVEGPIGVGKTSLVQRLADSFGSDALLEKTEENPFLERFYMGGQQAALPTQLFFLFQRSKQLQELRQRDMFRPSLVADYMLEKDPLFARLNLDDDELKLYEQVFAHLTFEAPAPDLVVYLQAPVEILMQRIKKRDRREERPMKAGYLQKLCDAYAEFFYYYDASPLLIINAADINPVERDADYQILLERICTIRSGKHYFNPAPMLV
ncbi:Deoxyadenosine kinase @ Deoxyguanosine kinase [hydrothermal vent metagenome]|uniref:Deoxyadenosine kinase @ Deoxyguanosine kinase n=1 Tax=hydrothermal vent metagenome TaxID=652676 RepID=A0A3B1BFL8_9ZZZZ